MIGNRLWLKAHALPTNTPLHIVAVLRAMAENYAAGHPWSEVDSYQVRAAADLIESLIAAKPDVGRPVPKHGSGP